MNIYPAKLIKAGFVSLLLFGLSLYLSLIISEEVLKQEFFLHSFEYSLKVILTMTAIMLVFSLSIGAWKGLEPYIFTAVPITLGIFLSLYNYGPLYAGASSALLLIIFCYDIFKSHQLKNNMIKFVPVYVLRLSTTGLLFIFSIVGGLMVLLTSASIKEINVGKNVTNMLKDPLQQAVQNQFLNDQEISKILAEQSGYDFDDPTLQALYKDAVQNAGLSKEDLSKKIDANIGEAVENQINTVFDPFKQFVTPLLALWMFGLFQFYAMFAKILYLFLVDIIFWIAKKSGFIKVATETVQKEALTF